MIKNIKTIIICSFFTVGLNAQSIQIENIVENLYDSGFDAITVKANIRNISDETLEIRVRREVNNVTEESDNFFCWAQCYGPNTNVSPTGLIAEPDGIISEFHGYYQNNGSTEIATIRYVFFLANKPSDSASFVASFDPQTLSIQNVIKNNNRVDVFPIPASDKVSFKLKEQISEPHFLEVYSLDGRLVQQIASPSQADLINLSCLEFENGVYLYVLRNNKANIQSGRFVVSR